MTIASSAPLDVAADAHSFDAFPDALAAAKDRALSYLRTLDDRPVSRAATVAEMAAALDEPLPETGCPAAYAVDEWFHRAEPGIVASSGPRFFGFVHGGTTPAALAGDWLASALDQNVGLWAMSPAGAQTELTVLRWLKELFGLPAEWEGAVTSGATMANLVGLAAARQWAGRRLGFDPAQDGLGGHPAIPIVSSTEIHASAVKALGTLGFGRGAIRRVAATGGVIDLDAFDRALADIAGPVIVVGNAGEVNTGAFDDLDALADRCAAHPGGAWLHVDGAFGLFAAASPRFAHLTRGVERADSVASDAHKWLNVPYDGGFAFVRDGDSLRAAFDATGSYLAAAPGAGYNPLSHVPEMSRRFRALSFWCALRADGRVGYRTMVERCVDNARSFADWVEATPDLELLAPAHLNIVCFRFRPTGVPAADIDALNRDANAAVQAGGDVFVSPTVWDGKAAVRAAFDNWATRPSDVDRLCDAIARQLDHVAT